MARLALCIGINNYPGTDMDLKGCINDARDWAAALTARGYTVRSLDARATNAAIVAGLRRFIKDAKRGDHLVISCSGHGTCQPDTNANEADGLDEALCPYDLKTRDALTDDEIRTLCLKLDPGARLPPLGHRHARSPGRCRRPASALHAEGQLAAAGRAAATVVAPTAASAFRGVLASRRGDLLISGCREGPNRDSDDASVRARPNGAFTYYALQTLHTLPAAATCADWHRRICEPLPSASFPQSPQIVGTAAMNKHQVLT